MLQQITKGIKISVETIYKKREFRNNRIYYIFNYFVIIENNSSTPVILSERMWKIFDSLNKSKTVIGKGVIGNTPLIKPNQSYSYSSGCILESNFGAMFGHYKMINTITNEIFNVNIPKFQLTTPELSN